MRRFRECRRFFLAKHWRKFFRRTTFIAVTGSCGKTTTADLLAEILSAPCTRVLTRGVNDSPVGAVRSILLSRPWRDRHLVFEVSGHQPGAILPSARLIQPDVAIVTKVASDHRRQFGSLEATAREKSELVAAVGPRGLAVLNADDPNVVAMREKSTAKVITFGCSEHADLRLLSSESFWPPLLRLKVSWRGETSTVESGLVGEHWSVAILAALATALELGMDRERILKAVSAFRPGFCRMSVHRTPDRRSFVLDTWKAPHWGLQACLGFLKSVDAPRKTVVFGTISDYRGNSRKRYEEAARWALEVADRVVFVGPESFKVSRLRESEPVGRIYELATVREAGEFLRNDMLEDEIIYVKSSRADHLDRLYHSAFAGIACWTDRCRLRHGCIHCEHLMGMKIVRHGFSQLPWLDSRDSRPL